MSADLALVLALLGAAVVMFAANKPRMDAAALIILTALPFTGVISMGEALSGFSDPNVVLIGALFVIGDGLVRAGVAQRLGDLLIARAGNSEIRLMVLLMLSVAALGAVMSSTGVVAIFIPIVLRIAQNTGAAPSRLMMPVSFAALISGMLTLVATAPNLVVNSELIRNGVAGFRFFSFTPFGLPVLLLGIAYMTVARRWLPTRRGPGKEGAARYTQDEWISEYQLARREYRVRVTGRSSLVGKTLRELNVRGNHGASILAIERQGRITSEIIRALPQTELMAGDVLFVDLFGSNTNIAELQQRLALESVPLSGAYFNDRSQEIGMAELMLPPDSDLLGKSVIENRFRTVRGLTVVGIRRGRTALDQDFLDRPLKGGDTLLVIGDWDDIRRLQSERRDLLLLNLPVEFKQVLPAATRAPHALFSLAVVVLLMVSGVVPNVQAALIGCILMGAFRCIDLASAYRSINWPVLILIVGMLPFSTALERTGAVDLAAGGLLRLTAGAGLHSALAAVFVVTAALGLFISNTATAVLMAPVAIAIAKALHASPYPFAMIVALGASTAFMTPVSSPVNTLVMEPGNYAFADFVRIGAPFAVIVMLVSVFLVPVILPP